MVDVRDGALGQAEDRVLGLVETGAFALLLLLVWLPRRIYDWDLRFDLPQIAYAGALFLTAIWIGYGRVEVSPFLYFRF